MPEKRQLIHAYFTPPAVCAEIARIVKPRLPELMSVDGKVHALEPSAGIGRFPLALSGPGFEALVWHCVEYSTVSSTMLHLLRPDIDLFQGPFERWIAERADAFAGRLKLIISNPPYGKRNMALTEDPDRSYRYDRADAYFLRRGLDLLGAGGLGIYIIPSGFLTGATEDAKKFRAEVLRRHHLAAAFRLPNEVFSLANVVTDLLLFRARGAILPDVDDADRFILEGRYYEEFPTHILGMLVPNVSGKRGWHTTAEGYTVVGAFTAIPPFEERPICARCQHLPAPGPIEPPSTPAATEASTVILEGDKHLVAVGLGRRVQAFLASVANPNHEPIGWDELHHNLSEWAETHGAPGKDQEVLVLAKAERGPRGHGEPGGAGWLLKAFLGASSTLIPPLAERPRWAPRFLGDANDPLQMGDYLYRTHKTLRIDELPGKDPSALFAAGWCEDSLSPAWTERLDVRGELFPPDEYLFGELWPKFNRADARGRLGDVQAAAQARRLLELIQPATFDEMESVPRTGSFRWTCSPRGSRRSTTARPCTSSATRASCTSPRSPTRTTGAACSICRRRRCCVWGGSITTTWSSSRTRARTRTSTRSDSPTRRIGPSDFGPSVRPTRSASASSSGATSAPARATAPTPTAASRSSCCGGIPRSSSTPTKSRARAASTRTTAGGSRSMSVWARHSPSWRRWRSRGSKDARAARSSSFPSRSRCNGSTTSPKLCRTTAWS